MSKHKYTWGPPQLRVGERRHFIDHNGARRGGECMRVETHYSPNGAHYHIYAMRPDERMNFRWVGDSQICPKEQS